MNGWIELEIARQRREDLLREAQEWRRIPDTGRRAESRGERMASARRFIRFLRPEANGGLAAPGKPGASIHECSAD